MMQDYGAPERKFHRPEAGLVVSEGHVVEGYASLFGKTDQQAAQNPAQFHRGSTAGEIITWVRECRVDPHAAIRAATLDAAFAMGVAGENGSIAPGKYADVIAVYGDVLRQIERLTDLAVVIHRGRRYR